MAKDIKKTKQFSYMMQKFQECGVYSASDRLDAISHIAGRKIRYYSELNNDLIQDMITALEDWKFLQLIRFQNGTVFDESLMFVKNMCDMDTLTASDNFVLPTHTSRKNFRKAIMAQNKVGFENPTLDELDGMISDIQKSNSGVQIIEVDPSHGRMSSDRVIPAPTTSLGLALGVGGIPRGKVIHVWGEKHGGKTLLANHFIAEAQRVDVPTVILDAEASADGAFLSDVGVDVSKVRIVQPTDLEALCTSLRGLAKSGAMIIVDSIAASESSAELERNLAKDHSRVGGNAALWKSTLSIFRGEARIHGTTLILINQLRANFNAGMMGDPHKPYGPEAIQHSADVSIRVTPVKEKKDALKKNGYKISRLRFNKNRMNGELAVIDLVFKPGYPYNRSIDLVRTCGNTIDAGSEMTYGELSKNALLADTAFDDEKSEFIPKKNRYSIAIDPYMMAAIRVDEPEFVEVDIEPVENYDDHWNSDRPAPDVDEENSAGFTLPGVGEINAMKWLKNHPTARDLISERMLNGLNRKRDFISEI